MSSFYIYDGNAQVDAALCGSTSGSWGSFMGFGSGIRKLQGIIALLLLSAVPDMAAAQALGQAQPAPIQQGQLPQAVPADASLATPPAPTQSSAAPPAATPQSNPRLQRQQQSHAKKDLLTRSSLDSFFG